MTSGTTSAGLQHVSKTLDDIPELEVVNARNQTFEATTTKNDATAQENNMNANINVNENNNINGNNNGNGNNNVNGNGNNNGNPTVPRRRRGLAREKSMFLGGREEVAKVVRQSAAVDIETGAPESKAFTVEEIHQAHQTPMDPKKRWRKSFLDHFGITLQNIDDDDDEEEGQQQSTSPINQEPVKQFRLKSKGVRCHVP